MRLIVTGGAGFIGSAVCRHLISHTDAEVTNVDKLTYAGNLASLDSAGRNSRYHFFKADICAEAAMKDLFAQTSPTAILHLAAESHVDRSIIGSRSFIDTNIVGTYTLLEAARRYWSGLSGAAKESFRFLHVSTDEVYGSLRAMGFSPRIRPMILRPLRSFQGGF
jgi:dTDP-glucose 4,6-dehydratase